MVTAAHGHSQPQKSHRCVAGLLKRSRSRAAAHQKDNISGRYTLERYCARGRGARWSMVPPSESVFHQLSVTMTNRLKQTLNNDLVDIEHSNEN
ncbi:hypothetical protein EVAR_65690_1 [Eumeta japonica]|uniref:Uncharacterized protein n=1 Tax=Eumeta variegata TaxID=151549 RepID=A0A4C1Z4X6_EUMVA|nr:hypothetical protein EVAR_65690_1 [Eumeta japonica]